MEERKIRGRSRRRKYKNQMRRPIAVLLALMLSFSSFGTATAYADAAEGSKTESQPEKMESEKWTEKTILDSGKQTDGVSVTRDASANAANEGKETGNDNEGGNDDGQTDGKTDNPYDSIERPAQSDTIEMIPGAPSDSKDKESDSGTDTKTDTKADTAEGSNPESGEAGESNDQNEQEKEGESENQPEGGQETEVKPLPAEEKNYDYIYDKEAGKFKITFHIKEDAKGDG